MRAGLDTETVDLALQGNASALERVATHLYPIVRKFIGYRFVSLRGGVEDATQECMLEVVRSLGHYRGQGRLEAWALRIAFRTARRLRERESLHQPVDLDALPEAVFRVDPEDRGAALDVLRALSRVSEKKRDALLLTAVLGLSSKEAGQVLGVLTFTVQSRVRHAKAELAEMLGDASSESFFEEARHG